MIELCAPLNVQAPMELQWCHEVPPNPPPPPPPPAPLAQDPPAPAQDPPPPPPAQDQPPAQPPPGPVPRPQAPPWGRWLDRDTNPCLNFQRIGESKQRPLELCSWTDLRALRPCGGVGRGRSHRRVSEHTAAQRIERRFHVNAAIVSDASSRVKGSLRHVFMYVTELQNYAAWSGIETADIKVTRGMGKPLAARHQYQMEHRVAGFKLPTVYEVVELQQDKKVVFAAASELHTATEQLIFMPDPNDPTFTVVRHISHVELTEWRRALQPVVAGLFKQLPDKGLQKLRTLLNSANTPLRELREAEAHAARRGREGGWGFTSMFNSLKQEMAQESWATGHSTMSPGMAARAASQAAIQSDAHGYYALLGLDGRRTQSVGTDDIKTAFRKAAQNLHPDKYSLSDDEERMEAEEAFKKVQRAYAVLKDPQQRKLYDSGKLNEETSLV
ncbi:hypothetical protein QJQ45_028941 [Haematococcus lacustris]|nr:hypothetical protein QJQ45_028941 [Haematococcus lacustris]